MTKRVQTQKI